MSTERLQIEKDYDRQILAAIASGRPITQRSLAGELGVALGLTNLLMRRLVAKGCVKVTGIGTRQVRYLMTPRGWAALGRATRATLENTVRLYTQTREQIRSSLSRAAQHRSAGPLGGGRVVFYGAGDVAEIAYVSLQGTNLTLVGVVDDRKTGVFFGFDIQSPAALTTSLLHTEPYDLLIVTSLRHAANMRARLASLAINSEHIWYL